MRAIFAARGPAFKGFVEKHVEPFRRPSKLPSSSPQSGSVAGLSQDEDATHAPRLPKVVATLPERDHTVDNLLGENGGLRKEVAGFEAQMERQMAANGVYGAGTWGYGVEG